MQMAGSAAVEAGSLFRGVGAIKAVALLLGERLDTRSLERGDALATAPLTIRAEGGCAVLFRYGVAVLFGAEFDEAALIERLRPLVSEPLATPERDELRVLYRPDGEDQVESSGEIRLRDAGVARLQLVADVLAKSLMLGHYETRIAGVFDRIEPLAATLRQSGRVGGGDRELLRQVGDVLLTQHKMVGRVEAAEKPELLWERPEFERLYARLEAEYELRERGRALERKFDLVSRTVQMLLGLLQDRRTLRVEWYVVALIVVEILLTLYTYLGGRF